MHANDRDWYVCHRKENSQIDCIGPFMSIFRADYHLTNDMNDAVLLSVCKYMPDFLTTRRLKSRYNEIFSVKNMTINKI